MPDNRFFGTNEPLSIASIAAMLDVDLPDDAGSLMGAMIARAASVTDDSLLQAVIHCSTRESLEMLGAKNYGLCLTNSKLVADFVPQNGAVLAVPSPKLAFAIVTGNLHYSLEEAEPTEDEASAREQGIHKNAYVAASAKIGAGVRVGAHAYIGRNVVIGAGTVIADNVSITHANIGARASILAGARIGQAGFGFVPGPSGLVRVPQLGRVIIGDDVEIGANTTIDRGALGDTTIGNCSKIDNLVQIGHNVQIGSNCVIAAQCGVSGSCIIEDGAMLGGQVGLADHLLIGAGAQIAARAGLMRDVPAAERWGGAPARPIKDWLRETAALTKLAKRSGKKNEPN